MALTAYRDAIADLLEVIDSSGGFVAAKHQVAVRHARLLLLREVEIPLPTTVIRCDTDTCPSRLVLMGELDANAAGATATGMGWWVAGDTHLCSACRRD